MSADKPSKIPPKGTPERSAYFAEIAAQRWSRPRPAPKSPSRSPHFPAGSPEELHWDERARALGLSEEGRPRDWWRRLLKRLANAELDRLRSLQHAGPVAQNADDDLLLVYLEREARRLRERAVRDREFADMHDAQANEAETRLMAHLRRLGLA